MCVGLSLDPQSEKFTTLDVLLGSSPHAAVLEALVDEEQWSNICNSKGD